MINKDCFELGSRHIKKMGWIHMTRAEREPITGVGGGAPVESIVQGHSSWSGALKLKTVSFSVFGCPTESAKSPHSSYFAKRRVKLEKRPTDLLPAASVKTRRICIKLWNSLCQKWDGHVHPVHAIPGIEMAIIYLSRNQADNLGYACYVTFKYDNCIRS